MKLRAFYSLLAFLIVGITLSWAAPKVEVSGGLTHDMGQLEEGNIYERSFTVNNSGDKELEIKALSPSCGCTVIISPRTKIKLAPGKSLNVKFSFDTAGMEGPVKRTIYIESNQPNEPEIKLILVTNVKRVAHKVISRFMSFGTSTVIVAGLIDGFNPCAFTVLIFFMSFLKFVGYRKRELLILGAAFIAAVFLTYVLLGLGIFKFIQSLEAFAVFSTIIYYAIALLALALGCYSLYDWHIYRKTGNPDEMRLKLPEAIKARIHKIIQDSSRNKTRTLIDLVLAVFLSGILVSLLESICTGQTYVPTIAYVLKTPELRARALGYLLLYNFMFIVPLLLIFAASLRGAGSEAFAKIVKKYLGPVKLSTAALFFLLGFLLIIMKILSH